jgi:hypothetical protein
MSLVIFPEAVYPSINTTFITNQVHVRENRYMLYLNSESVATLKLLEGNDTTLKGLQYRIERLYCENTKLGRDEENCEKR